MCGDHVDTKEGFYEAPASENIYGDVLRVYDFNVTLDSLQPEYSLLAGTETSEDIVEGFEMLQIQKACYSDCICSMCDLKAALDSFRSD